MRPESWYESKFSKRLDNGVRVIIDGDDHSNLVSVQIWIAVGSAAEKPNEHGCAHLLEHMLFESKYGEEHLIAKIEQLGGDASALVGEDLTLVYTTVSIPNHLQALEMLLDAVTTPVLNSEKLELEKQVVLSELVQFFADPFQKIDFRSQELFFGDDEYGRHPIGTPDEIRAQDVDALRKFHRECYVGSNISIVVSGGANRQQVVSLCEQYLGQLPAHGRSLPDDQCKYQPGIEIERHEAEFCMASISFPGASRQENSLEMLTISDLLQSRLEQELCESNSVALTVATTSVALRRGGKLQIGIAFSVDMFEKMLEIAFDTISDFTRFPLHQKEFEEDKDMRESGMLYVQESVEERALFLGMLSIFNRSTNLVEEHFDYLRNLKIEKVHELAKGRLRLDQASVYVCIPKKEISEQAAKDIKARVGNRLKEPRKSHGRKIAALSHGIEEVEFDGGLRLYAWRSDRLPFVCGSLEWLGGCLIESEDQAGATRLLASCMSIDNLPIHLLKKETEKTNISWSVDAGNSSVEMDFYSESQHTPWIIERVLKMSHRPTIAKTDFDAAVQANNEGRKIRKSQFNVQARARMKRLLFQGHPHGRVADHSMEQFCADDLLSLWETNYSLDHAVLGLAGKFDLDLIVDLIHRWLSRNPRSETAVSAVPDPPKFLTSPVVERCSHPLATTAHIFTGWPIDVRKRDIKRSVTFEVLRTVVGGTSGYLFETIRNEHGLVYHIGMGRSFCFNSGCVYVQTETARENLERVLELIDQQIARIRLKSIDKRDFNRAIAVVRKKFGASLEYRSAIASLMAGNTILGWSPTHIFERDQVLDNVTMENVQNMANELFIDRHRVTSIVEPEG